MYKDITKRLYFIEPYDPKWIDRFNNIKNKLQRVFPEALNIEHIGSTSIKGMFAKPCIDILIIVSKISPFFNKKEEIIK